MPADSPAGVVLAVDPGRDKCGLAVVVSPGQVLHREVCPTQQLPARVQELAVRFPVAVLVLGDRTGARGSGDALRALPGLPEPTLVDEAGSTLEARERWRREVPARGWRRLLPVALRLPREPIDDWAAVILAERYLGGRPAPGGEAG